MEDGSKNEEARIFYEYLGINLLENANMFKVLLVLFSTSTKSSLLIHRKQIGNEDEDDDGAQHIEGQYPIPRRDPKRLHNDYEIFKNQVVKCRTLVPFQNTIYSIVAHGHYKGRGGTTT